ncbi:MAG: hypothetical protein RAK25_05445 [TACK group archaeon]|nr:hypothetical protein [TACK group archaeon]
MPTTTMRDRVVDAFKRVEAGEASPFSWDVKASAQALREELGPTPDDEDLIEDAKAVDALSGIVGAQGREVEFMATSSVLNPFMLEKSVDRSNVEALARALWQSISPSVDILQVTIDVLIASSAWSPIRKRISWSKRSNTPLSKAEVKKGDEFGPKIDAIIDELKAAVKNGETDYVSFIKKGDPVERAYLLSFAITDGRVLLNIDPISGKITIKPSERRAKTNASVVIALEELPVERR